MTIEWHPTENLWTRNAAGAHGSLTRLSKNAPKRDATMTRARSSSGAGYSCGPRHGAICRSQREGPFRVPENVARLLDPSARTSGAVRIARGADEDRLAGKEICMRFLEELADDAA